MARRSVSSSTSASSSTSKKGKPSSATKMVAAKAQLPKASEGSEQKVPHTVLLMSDEEDRRSRDLVGQISARFDARLADAMEAEIESYRGDPPDLSMSVETYLHEARALACLAEWHANPRGKVSVGLAPHAPRLGGDIAAQILYLCKLGKEGEILVEQGRTPIDDVVIKRGLTVFRRLRSALDVVVDDGVQDKKDVAIAALKRQHESSPRTFATLASGLEAYAAMGTTLAADLATLHGFEMSMIDEATSIAGILVSRAGTTPTVSSAPLVARRDAILGLIRARVQKLRRVMRFAFSEYPSLLKATASTHDRERRRASKAKPVKPTEDETEPKPKPSPHKPTPVDDPSDDSDRIPDDLIDDDE